MHITKWPTVSIITPCFNAGEYLEETILSVLEQNYPNLEYIIIDGGSTDNSIEIIKKYEHKLFYWVSEKDSGMYDAIEKGFKKSTGDIMAWINADDLYHKNSLYIVAEIFSKYVCVNWLVGASTHWDEYGRGINVDRSRKFTRYDFLSGDFKWIQQESCFFRRKLWEKAGGYINTALRYAGDFELWLRFFRFEQLYVTNALIGGFRMRSANQLSLEGMPKYLKEVKDVLKNEKISKKDKRIIRRYKTITCFFDLILKMTRKVLNKYKKIECGYIDTNDIYFDREKQQFKTK
jgi:glycosyltransferase involved in cell wall biosynthesis